MNVTGEDAEIVAEDRDPADAGISMASVAVMLAVLFVVVVGLYWALPAMFSSQVIEITIRK